MPSGAMAMPSGFPFRDGAFGSDEREHHDGMPLELEPTFTAQDEQKELATLSIPDIVKLQSDLHGITAGISGLNIDERTDTRSISTSMDQPVSPEAVATLSRLDEEMSRLPTEGTAAYRRALTECPDQVSEERKMAFLEYEDGDAVLAATRLAKYWEFRLNLFGPERCFLPMTLDGAMKDEVEPMVNRRIWQLMPVRDTAGRAFFYRDPSRRNFAEYSLEQEFRVLFYLLETVIEDTDLRRRGFVVLTDGRNMQRKHYSRKLKHLSHTIESSLPIRHRAFHVCYPSKVLYYLLFPVLKHFLCRDVRLRMKLHCGSTAEVLRDLEVYCLPRDRLPTELDGDVALDMHKWVEERMVVEISRTADPNILVPAPSADGPFAKRMRNENDLKISAAVMPVPSAPAPITVNGQNQRGKSHGKEKIPGRRSDPRMDRAIEAKLAFPALSLRDALISGGFVFREDRNRNVIVDADGITLAQRKNNLCRRLRTEKQKRAGQGIVHSTELSTEVASNVASEQDLMAHLMPVPPHIKAVGTSSLFQGESGEEAGFAVAQQPTLSLQGNVATKTATNSSTDNNNNRTNGNRDGDARRDSFYESILELPGLDDVDGLDFMDVV